MEKGALTEEAFRKMGAMMANLHKASSDFNPSRGFASPTWGSQSFNRDWTHLRQHHRHFIADEAFELHDKAAAKVADRLGTFTSHERNFGMIHADLPLEIEGLIEEQPYAQAILRAYLNGTPFLFQLLEVSSLNQKSSCRGSCFFFVYYLRNVAVLNSLYKARRISTIIGYAG